ncbi:hypothetical protein [Curtobacterium sp. SL109]|uniref:hypothetical protein n=1 Tax=Curtobacterium sp. SL109 TaxID=2994662 RepID=UPI0022756F92|nr:hypothetical protein [Curtobacterium sp. SL109]MCY1692871.1 hypothetical protein [Curtobacterium sp. SL109]
MAVVADAADHGAVLGSDRADVVEAERTGAQSGVSDIVIVPTVDSTGFALETTVLLAVGIPIAAETAASDELEEKNPSFVSELAERTP